MVWVSPHPSAPSNFAGAWAAPPGSDLALTWTAVTETWATGYEYCYREGSTDSWSEWTAIAGGRTTEMMPVPGLKTTNAYDFQIRTKWSGGVWTRYVGDVLTSETSGTSLPSGTLAVEVRD